MFIAFDIGFKIDLVALAAYAVRFGVTFEISRQKTEETASTRYAEYNLPTNPPHCLQGRMFSPAGSISSRSSLRGFRPNFSNGSVYSSRHSQISQRSTSTNDIRFRHYQDHLKLEAETGMLHGMELFEELEAMDIHEDIHPAA
ncbi:hypothetical protein TWF718_007896 [Orbilia javanica]|uniref:Uncharacterized protein n=1 Tax=Orbilia javanica TaxID=47235 RepID=A0AAN8RCP8_9PEZI